MAKPPPTPEKVLNAASFNPVESFAPLVDAVAPSVVSIEVKVDMDVPEELKQYLDNSQRRPAGEASGFIIDSKGYVLTNYHVIQRADEAVARLHTGERVPLVYVGGDKEIDMALLRLGDDRKWPALEFKPTDEVRLGDWVLAVGNPLGLGLTVTAGIISGKGRNLNEADTGYQLDNFIQTDAAINQGNSGGPLLSQDGKVVGMVTAIMAGANTVGFAIPSVVLQRALPDIRREGRIARGFLGVHPRTLKPVAAASMGLDTTEGAVLERVLPNTPASKAGLQAGDVIVSVDDEKIADSAALLQAVGTRRPGDVVSMVVLRAEGSFSIKLVLEQLPERESPRLKR